MGTLHRFVVPAELAGQRLDRCLAALHTGWTRSYVRRLIDRDCVTLNNEKVKPAAVVRAGDEAVVDEPPLQPAELTAEDIPLKIVFEDRHLLVLDKVAGIVIHPAAGNPSGTLVNALLHHCQDLSGIGGVERPGIVHRLDKDTTGLMVVAKSDRAHLGLSLAFRWHKVEKTYLAVCYGSPHPSEGVIDAPIDRHPSQRQHMAVVDTGRPARTAYSIIEDLGGLSVVSCRPVSGRTHQIRVHMAHIGHALVGDPLYSGRQWRGLAEPQRAAACRHFPRQALHAWRLAFTHPVSDQRLQFEAPWPGDLVELIELLRRQSA